MNGLHKIFKALIFTCLVFMIGTAVSTQVYAFSLSTTPEISYENYDVNVLFRSSGVITESGSVSFNADLTGISSVCIPRYLYVERCPGCGMSFFENDVELHFSINGRAIDYDNRRGFDDPSNRGNWYSTWYNFSISGLSNSRIELTYKAGAMKCTECGQYSRSSIYMDGIYFKGKRGHAAFAGTTVETVPSGQITLSPEYDMAADHVVWAIRYPGNENFELLNEGANGSGISATGVNNKSLTVSNIPYINGGFDLGVFVYTRDGLLPAGTDFPYTPYFTHVTYIDRKPPAVSVTKQQNPSGGTVRVTVNASDDCGLHAAPYSWDGGNTYGTDSSRDYNQAGTYKVTVRDSAGNISEKSFYIDSTEIKKPGNPGSSTGSIPQVTETEQDKGKGGNSTGTAGTGGTGTGGAGSGGAGGQTTSGSGSLNYSKNEGKEHVTTGTSSGGSTSNNKDVIDKEPVKGSSKGGTGSKNDGLNPTDISDEESDDTFERIKENSEEYIIAMQENDAEQNNASPDSDAILNLETVDEEQGTMNYTDDGNLEMDGYTPNAAKTNGLAILGTALLVLIFILIMAFVLFFGVIIYEEKETELSAINGTEGVKVPVALSIVTYSNGRFGICFRELLNRHDVLYARVGILFAYMYEGDSISIQTKFKGEKKREIAVEKIAREIKAGNKKKK